jgi:hypothetical protein
MSLLIFCCAQVTRPPGASPKSLSRVSANVQVVPSLVGSLKQELKEWKTWDTIKMIQRHGNVKRRILGFFNNNLQVRREQFYFALTFFIISA